MSTRLRFIIGLATVSLAACTGLPRSESWLRTHFAKHEPDFDQLVGMSNTDFAKTRVIRIAYDFTRLEDDWSWPRAEANWGISRKRWDEYRHMFRELELPAGLNRDGERYGEILLMMHGVGMAGEGNEYGYLWSSEPPAQIDTDRQYFATKPLKGNWYLYEWKVY